ncbi:MAG: hypothetical protein ACE5KY_01505 [Candidatus Tectimicrobiota bacterium]
MNYQIFLDGLGVGFLLGLLVAYVLSCFTGRPKAKTPRRDIDKLVDQFEEHYREVRRRDANLPDE